jgi:hypothetical protein
MSLDVPSWVPTSVAGMAARLHNSATPAGREAIERIMRERRMRIVWVAAISAVDDGDNAFSNTHRPFNG